jgi:hypothetical protein
MPFPMSMRNRHMPFVPAASLCEAPEVKQALARAEENAARAHSANNAQEREYYERMSRKSMPARRINALSPSESRLARAPLVASNRLARRFAGGLRPCGCHGSPRVRCRLGREALGFLRPARVLRAK